MSAGSRQAVAAVLGLVAALLVGAIIVILLADPTRPAPSASPTLAAALPPTLAPPLSAPAGTTPIESPPTAEPSPTVPPTAEPPPTVAPTAEPPPTAPPTDPPTAAPTAPPTAAPTAPPTAVPPPTEHPSPGVTPSAPEREILFTGLGLDAPDSPEPAERFLTFGMDGPGELSAIISDVTAGRVRICLWRGDPVTRAEPECRSARHGGLLRTVSAAGPTQWTVSLIGATEQTSPTATVRLRFRAQAPAVSLERFRFQGEAIENYNGFVAELSPGATGSLELVASWADDEGGAYPYRMVVEEIGSPGPHFETEGSAANAAHEAVPVTMDRSYRVTFANSVEVAETQVFLSASLSWP